MEQNAIEIIHALTKVVVVDMFNRHTCKRNTKKTRKKNNNNGAQRINLRYFMRFTPIYTVNKSQIINSCVKNGEMSQLHFQFLL